MKRNVCFATVCALVLSVTVTGNCWGATSDPYVYTEATLNPHRLIIICATLGNNWSGFPTFLATDYAPTVPMYEELDAELPLYVTWMLDSSTSEYWPGRFVDPPLPITSFDWFSFFYNGFKTFRIEQDVTDVEYYTCPASVGIEAPQLGSFPVTADGKLRVSDIHGGFGNETLIHLRYCSDEEGVDCEYTFHIIVSWTNPGVWYDDYLQAEVDRAPGSVYNRAARFDFSGASYVGYAPVRIVEWISTDLGIPDSPGPSPRAVDAADLAYWFAFCDNEIGHPARFGFGTGETPPNSPNYHCNVVPWGNHIDPSDLAAFIGDLNDRSCQLSKAGADEFAAMLDWFGVAPTGRMLPVNPNGDLAPEYAVVDWEKNRRAIADPYGYRTNLSATPAMEAPWGLVKQLYR